MGLKNLFEKLKPNVTPGVRPPKSFEQGNENVGLAVIEAFKKRDAQRAFLALKKLDEYTTGALDGAFAEPPDVTLGEVVNDIGNFISKIERKDAGRLLVPLASEQGSVSVVSDDQGEITLGFVGTPKTLPKTVARAQTWISRSSKE